MRDDLYCRTCNWRGGFKDIARTRVDGKLQVICPVCGRVELYVCDPTFNKCIYTTQQKTFNSNLYRKFIYFWNDPNIDDEVVWVFSDGSSTGSFSSVVLEPGKKPRELVRHLPQPANRNVGAEIMGVAMGLKHCPVDSDVTVVSDYLGTGLWMNCYWKIADPAATPRLGIIRHLVQVRRLRVTFIHHKGHQRDHSDFTKWNNRCDELCSVKARKLALGE